MDINKLPYFFAAAELGSFTEAARKCHIAQTTMSKYISSLEKETKVPLFIRTHSGGELTEEGKQFYTAMKHMDEEYRTLLASLSTPGNSLTLGIAAQEYRGLHFLPAFRRAFPEISISYHIEPPEKLEEELASRRIDGILSPEAIPFPRSFRTLDLVPIPQCLVCSRGNAKKYPTIPDILEHLYFLTKSTDPGYTEKCREKFLRRYKTTFTAAEEVTTFTEQLLRLSLGQGFSILPLMAGKSYDGLSTFPLDQSFNEYTRLICRKSDISRPLARLIAFFHEK